MSKQKRCNCGSLSRWHYPLGINSKPRIVIDIEHTDKCSRKGLI